MKKRIRSVILLAALGTLGLVFFVFHPQAEEVGDDEAPGVSEHDLDLYIKIYTAMQDDHDLTIDSAITPYSMSLDDFRQIERRIQSQQRSVDRVRESLLEHAKSHSVFALSLTPTPVPSPTETKTHKPKKK